MTNNQFCLIIPNYHNRWKLSWQILKVGVTMYLDTDSINWVTNILNHMQDSLSASLYLHRLLYSVTNDKKYMENLLYLNPQGQKLKKAKECNNLVVFGCGVYGRHFLELFDLPITCFSDNNPQLWGGKVL